MNITLDELTALAKRRGFVFPTSEIYGGISNAYDYGPLGVELMLNLKIAWWKYFVKNRADVVGLDSQIILHPQTWVASGHVSSFSDPLVEDKVTHERFRADHIIETWFQKHPQPQAINLEGLSLDEYAQIIKDHNITSPKGNPLTEPKSFNLLFETSLGVVAGQKSTVYLRGETAQGIFSNFKQILDTTRVQLPFGIAQMGKSFRNEITQGQFIFRTFEFEQAEIEYFFNPETTVWQELMNQWKQSMWDFATEVVGLNPAKLRWRRHDDKERSFYSTETFDLEYEFPFGFKELWGIAYRTDYDLKQHQQFSNQKLEYTDPHTGEKFVPHVIEPALGLNRLLMAVMIDGYFKDEQNNRTVLKFPTLLAPYTVAVFPLVKNKPEITNKAQAIHKLVAARFAAVWDDRGNIGKRYFYQDEIGTPFCITIDYQTLEDGTVTVRHRDSASQERVAETDLINYLYTKQTEK
jgi:glycyl-tRNA synthetase